MYVDDRLLLGTDAQFNNNLVLELDTQFSLKRLGELSYFLGFDTVRLEAGLILSQSKYASDLSRQECTHKANVVNTHLLARVKLFISTVVKLAFSLSV